MPRRSTESRTQQAIRVRYGPPVCTTRKQCDLTEGQEETHLWRKKPRAQMRTGDMPSQNRALTLFVTSGTGAVRRKRECVTSVAPASRQMSGRYKGAGCGYGRAKRSACGENDEEKCAQIQQQQRSFARSFLGDEGQVTRGWAGRARWAAQ